MSHHKLIARLNEPYSEVGKASPLPVCVLMCLSVFKSVFPFSIWATCSNKREWAAPLGQDGKWIELSKEESIQPLMQIGLHFYKDVIIARAKCLILVLFEKQMLLWK